MAIHMRDKLDPEFEANVFSDGELIKLSEIARRKGKEQLLEAIEKELAIRGIDRSQLKKQGV